MPMYEDFWSERAGLYQERIRSVKLWKRHMDGLTGSVPMSKMPDKHV